MKKKAIIIWLIVVSICIFVGNVSGYNNTPEQLPNCQITQSLQAYIFVKQWGDMGREDGEFGGLGCASDSAFIITDEVIEKLKNKIDKEKLKSLEAIKDRKFADRYEFLDTLKELKFSKEIFMIGHLSALKKLSDIEANGPLNIAVDKSDNIYVSDLYNVRIQKFDSEGNFILKWGSGGENDGQFKSIRGITVDVEGYVYVVEVSNHRVQKFNSQGNFILKWGSEGLGEGKFDLASEITTDLNGYIYVVDRSNSFVKYSDRGLTSRLQKFDSNGNFIQQYYFSSYVTSIAINTMGYIFLSTSYWRDSSLYRYKFLEGTYPENYSELYLNDNFKTFYGEFKDSLKLATNKEGDLFVADRGSCIYKFASDGKLLTKFGSFGSGEGQFNRPEAIAVDSKGNVYVMDTGNYRIQKFAPVP